MNSLRSVDVFLSSGTSDSDVIFGSQTEVKVDTSDLLVVLVRDDDGTSVSALEIESKSNNQPNRNLRITYSRSDGRDGFGDSEGKRTSS